MLWQLKYFKDSLRHQEEGERGFRKVAIYVILAIIVAFTISLFTAIMVGFGMWALIWLPLGLTIFGVSLAPLLVVAFVLYSYPSESKLEFSLKIQ